MRAVVFAEPGRVALADVPDPGIEAPGDVVVDGRLVTGQPDQMLPQAVSIPTTGRRSVMAPIKLTHRASL